MKRNNHMVISMPLGIEMLLIKLSVIMGAALLLSNILAAKIWGFQTPSFRIFGLEALEVSALTFTFDGGLILFPLTFLVGDMIAEIFGERIANSVAWSTAIFNLISFATINIANAYLPTYTGASGVNLDIFCGASFMVTIGSSASFLVSRVLNNAVFKRVRNDWQKKFHFSALVSSFLGRLLDTVLFNAIAYGGRLNDWSLIRHMICAFSIGMILEAFLCTFLTAPLVGRIVEKYQYQDGNSLD